MPAWILAPAAAVDLEEILDYILQDGGSDAAVERVEAAFLEALETLASSPRMGWRRTQLTGSDIRWWRVLSYLVVYEVDSRPLRIIRIVHGARDLAAIFAE